MSRINQARRSWRGAKPEVSPWPWTQADPCRSVGVQAVAAGAAKAALPAGTTLVLGVLAGAFIGFGSFLALSVGGACPGLASANPGLQKMVLVRAGPLLC